LNRRLPLSMMGVRGKEWMSHVTYFFSVSDRHRGIIQLQLCCLAAFSVYLEVSSPLYK
jgi:hypothetical protein